MNKFIISGRITKDISTEMKNGVPHAFFSVAIDRGKKDGKDLGTDFPSIKVFGKLAENVAKYTGKGKMVVVEGHIQTGSYEKDGKIIYASDLVAERIDFIEWKEGGEKAAAAENAGSVPAAGVEEDPSW